MRIVHLVLAAATIIAVASCTTTTTQLDAATSSPATTTSAGASAPSTTSSAPAKSVRGNVVKKLGELAYVDGPGGTAVTWSLDGVDVDTACTRRWAEAANRAHTLTLHVTITTTAALSAMPAGWLLRPNNFRLVDASGVTESGLEGAGVWWNDCPSDQLPRDTYQPSSQYKGSMVLVSNQTSGTLVYLDQPRPDGWEWQLP